MSILDSIDEFLPKYLSESSANELKEELKNFPTDGTKDTVYTTMLASEATIFQGDGFIDIPYYDANSQKVSDARVVVLSNTCDMSLDNKRLESMNVCVAPLLNMDKYIARLQKTYTDEQIQSHIAEIKKQSVTHVLYLPKNANMPYDAIVRLDKVCSVNRSLISNEAINQQRLFTLSDYGLYLFLLKISIHFTRIRERIDRNQGAILPVISFN